MFTTKTRRRLALVPLVLASFLTHADDLSDLKAKLADKFPNNKPSEVRHAPISGLYEIDAGRNVAYTDKDATFMIFGHIFDMSNQSDLTQKRIDELSKVDFSKLPLSQAIKIVKGTGANKFAVFSDPDCPYCKKLETSLQSMTDYTEYVFLFPIDGLHPGSSSKAQSIWCSKNPAKAWKEALVDGKTPETKTCANPVEKDKTLGSGFGVQGTPTLINSKGRLVPGAVDGQALDDFVKAK